MTEKEDISRRTVVVLLVVTIVISVLSTWTIINAIQASAPLIMEKKIPDVEHGKVNVNIEPQECGDDECLGIENCNSCPEDCGEC